MDNRRTICVLVAALLLCGLALSCEGQGATGTYTPPRDIMGVYYSDNAVGALGELKLTISWLTTTGRYKGTLESTSDTDFGTNVGLGTLGGGHLSLNFFANKDSASFYYYFLDAAITPSDGDVTAITGNFVFPDQSEQLAVTFRPH